MVPVAQQAALDKAAADLTTGCLSPAKGDKNCSSLLQSSSRLNLSRRTAGRREGQCGKEKKKTMFLDMPLGIGNTHRKFSFSRLDENLPFSHTYFLFGVWHLTFYLIPFDAFIDRPLVNLSLLNSNDSANAVDGTTNCKTSRLPRPANKQTIQYVIGHTLVPWPTSFWPCSGPTPRAHETTAFYAIVSAAKLSRSWWWKRARRFCISATCRIISSMIQHADYVTRNVVSRAKFLSPLLGARALTLDAAGLIVLLLLVFHRQFSHRHIAMILVSRLEYFVFVFLGNIRSIDLLVLISDIFSDLDSQSQVRIRACMLPVSKMLEKWKCHDKEIVPSNEHFLISQMIRNGPSGRYAAQEKRRSHAVSPKGACEWTRHGFGSRLSSTMALDPIVLIGMKWSITLLSYRRPTSAYPRPNLSACQVLLPDAVPLRSEQEFATPNGEITPGHYCQPKAAVRSKLLGLRVNSFVRLPMPPFLLDVISRIFREQSPILPIAIIRLNRLFDMSIDIESTDNIERVLRMDPGVHRYSVEF
ncbi:uncharacterized protein BDR25DRAFT_350198 [Lindgomyces ingoldianus]|uniref:Uncharacterized protein n=1 Tax=Lindgomyces ingoldianus TaxID=673940 RepID=A0ACB6R9F3_9PLEO|nr:uncharacterized protein BDR25DRAFT_350198 [Lindgomyces ingoldianus]KAF2475918.1 hypothetical protein BDR25DRAFT_350198 [Lindgomyces ingoldianus]